MASWFTEFDDAYADKEWERQQWYIVDKSVSLYHFGTIIIKYTHAYFKTAVIKTVRYYFKERQNKRTE